MTGLLLRICLLGAIVLATPARAQTVTGTVTATFDGEDLTWNTLRYGDTGDSESSAAFQGGLGMASLAMQAHRTDRPLTEDVLWVTLTWIGAKPGAGPASLVELEFFPSGSQGAYWTSDAAPQPATATVTQFALTDTAGRAEGTFAATLCRVEKLGADPDSTDCKPITGQFATDFPVIAP
jgi:hypothetical protein